LGAARVDAGEPVAAEAALLEAMALAEAVVQAGEWAVAVGADPWSR
jgi:hypothetical protein